MSPESESWWTGGPGELACAGSSTDPPPQAGLTAAPGGGQCHCLTREQGWWESRVGGGTLPAFLTWRSGVLGR